MKESSNLFETYTSYGECLKKLLKELKITQEQLANRLGIKRGQVSKYVNNHVMPNKRRREAINKAIGNRIHIIQDIYGKWLVNYPIFHGSEKSFYELIKDDGYKKITPQHAVMVGSRDIAKLIEMLMEAIDDNKRQFFFDEIYARLKTSLFIIESLKDVIPPAVVSSNDDDHRKYIAL